MESCVFRSRAIALWCAAAVLLVPRIACGHATGENYVWLNIDEAHLEGRFEVRLADLRAVLGLTIPEVYEDARPIVEGLAGSVTPYLTSEFTVSGPDGPIGLTFGAADLLRSPTMGHFARFHFRSETIEIPDRLTIRNTLFFDGNPDPRHRSLICMEYNKKAGTNYTVEVEDPAAGELKTRRPSFTAMVFAPHKAEQSLDLMRVQGVYGTPQFFKLGIKQVPKSLDHVLAFVALLLPAVLYRPTIGGDLRPADGPIRAIARSVLVCVVFGVCLSVVYGLSAWGVVRVPGRLVGAAAAFAVGVVAFNNIRPFFGASALVIIGALGMLHGLWLAEGLADLPFRMRSLNRIVVYFGLGFDAAMAAVVVFCVGLLYAIRRWSRYQSVVLKGGSAGICAIAAWLFVQRAIWP